MDISKIIKSLREEKKIGQQELAEALNVSRKTISHWETGYSAPSIPQLIALANYFNVTIDELVGRSIL